MYQYNPNRLLYLIWILTLKFLEFTTPYFFFKLESRLTDNVDFFSDHLKQIVGFFSDRNGRGWSCA